MPRIPREIALTPEELDTLMTSTWNMRIATIGPGTRINLTPMYFGWAGGKIYTFARGQKVANIRRNPAATVLVDRNERFPELVGAMFQGRGTVLEDADAEAADPDLETARKHWGEKYTGTRSGGSRPSYNPSTAGGKTARWIRFEPDRLISWDNHKIQR